MAMASGRPSRPGDVRLAHGARVDSVRVLACCTLRTISSAHQGAQGRSGRARREALAGSRGQQQQQQQPIRPLAPRDARRVEPASSTPCDAHLARSPRNPSTRRFFGRHRRAAASFLSPPRPVDRSPACLECTLAHTQLAAASCSPPPRLAAGSALSTRPALRASSLTRSRPSSRVRSSRTGSTLDCSTRLGLLPGSLCIPSTPVPHLTEV